MGYFIGVVCSNCGYRDEFAFGRGAHDIILDGERTPWYCSACKRTFGLKWLGAWRVGGAAAPPCPVCHKPLKPYTEPLKISDEDGETLLNACPRCHARSMLAQISSAWD